VKKRRVSHESKACPYADMAIVPTKLLKDRLLGDDNPEDSAKSLAARRALGNATGLCPDSTTPTPEHPFIFYQMQHCNGDVLLPLMLSSAAAMNVSVAIPGQGVLPAACSLAWDVNQSTAASCMADPGFPKASLYFGTFSPLRLGRVSHGTCVVMLRNPLSRAMAQYYAMFGLSGKFDYNYLAKMNQSDLDNAIQAVGSGLYMSRYLGCTESNCEGMNAHEVLEVARQQLQRCHVGITEMARETMAYLQMVLPWFDGSFTALDNSKDIAPDSPEKLKDVLSRLSSMFQGDNFLYEDGQKAFMKQLRGIWSCYAEEQYMGEEPQLVREVRKIARRVSRRQLVDRVQMSTCLERRKLCSCSGHTVDARGCRCYELMESRDD
jgi:hypothetical protein